MASACQTLGFWCGARKLIKPHLMQSFGGPNSGPDPSDTWPKCEFEAAAIRPKVRRRMEFLGKDIRGMVML